jgi:hypothetical protein
MTLEHTRAGGCSGALVILAGAVLLTSCSGSPASAVSPGAIAPNIVRASLAGYSLGSGNDETLAASHVKIVMVDGNCRENPPVYQAWDFHTSGAASGVITGTFSADGGWGLALGYQDYNWSFVESFTIQDQHHNKYFGVMWAGSPSRAPDWNCKPPSITGPFNLAYQTVGAKEQATVSIVKASDFSETLSNL